MRAWLSIVTLGLLPFVHSVLVNRTIDDHYPDVLGIIPSPVYSPPGAWLANFNCTGCLVAPDATPAFEQTWSEATFDLQSTQRGPGDHGGTAVAQVLPAVDFSFNGMSSTLCYQQYVVLCRMRQRHTRLLALFDVLPHSKTVFQS